MRDLIDLHGVALATLVLALGVGEAAGQTGSPVDIVGLDPDWRDRIRTELPARAAPGSLFEAQRLSEEAVDHITEALRSEGYYAPQIIAAADERGPIARVSVDAGPQFMFTGVSVAFVGAAPDEEARAAVDAVVSVLTPGAPAIAQRVLDAEAAAVAALQAGGYPQAKAAGRDVVVDHAEAGMTIAFAFDAGPLVRFGAVRARPPSPVRDDFLQSLSTIEPGRNASPGPMAALRRELLATGAFQSAEVALAPDGVEPGVRDVVVSLTPVAPEVWELGAGWSTAEGLGVEAAWTRRNLTGRADPLTIEASLSEQQQRLSAMLLQPHGGGRGRAWRLGVAAERDISGPFERTGLRVAASQDARARDGVGISIGASLSADVFTRSEGVEQALTATGYFDVRRDDTDDPLDAREGAVLQARIEPSFSGGDEGSAFVRALGEARGFLSLDGQRRITLAGRLKGGWVEPLIGEDDAIPPDRRFYAGGGGSVRGYAFNSIFPDRGPGRAPGGRALLETGLELRGRFDDRLGAVAFVDGGVAFDDDVEARKIRWGAGVGVRYDLGFGPFRLDVATPLDRRPGDAAVSVYVSIGQAF